LERGPLSEKLCFLVSRIGMMDKVQKPSNFEPNHINLEFKKYVCGTFVFIEMGSVEFDERNLHRSLLHAKVPLTWNVHMNNILKPRLYTHLWLKLFQQAVHWNL
jgi:hypothetical protein